MYVKTCRAACLRAVTHEFVHVLIHCACVHACAGITLLAASLLVTVTSMTIYILLRFLASLCYDTLVLIVYSVFFSMPFFAVLSCECRFIELVLGDVVKGVPSFADTDLSVV